MKRLLCSLQPFALAAVFAVSFFLLQAFFAGFDIGGGGKKVYLLPGVHSV